MAARQKQDIVVAMGAPAVPWDAVAAHTINHNGVAAIPNLTFVRDVQVQFASGWRSVGAACAKVTAADAAQITVRLAPAAGWDEPPLDAIVLVHVSFVYTTTGDYLAAAIPGDPLPPFGGPVIPPIPPPGVPMNVYRLPMGLAGDDWDFLVDGATDPTSGLVASGDFLDFDALERQGNADPMLSTIRGALAAAPADKLAHLSLKLDSTEAAPLFGQTAIGISARISIGAMSATNGNYFGAELRDDTQNLDQSAVNMQYDGGAASRRVQAACQRATVATWNQANIPTDAVERWIVLQRNSAEQKCFTQLVAAPYTRVEAADIAVDGWAYQEGNDYYWFEISFRPVNGGTLDVTIHDVYLYGIPLI